MLRSRTQESQQRNVNHSHIWRGRCDPHRIVLGSGPRSLELRPLAPLRPFTEGRPSMRSAHVSRPQEPLYVLQLRRGLLELLPQLLLARWRPLEVCAERPLHCHEEEGHLRGTTRTPAGFCDLYT